jgi:cytoskeletal protein CcmA (bactofilin family)
MTMFGKRKQQQGKPEWREPAASTPPLKETAASGDDKPDGDTAQTPSSAPSAPAAPAKPAPRPDPSAVLNRQPAPPVRPDQFRRNGGQRQPGHGTQPAESKQLTVGRDIEVSGEIRACDRLVVEGKVEADLSDSKVLEVAASGAFKGSAIIDVAEIAGRFEGDLTVRERLYLRSTGQVTGTIRYRGLEIESGGRIGGTLVELSEEEAREAVGHGDDASSAASPAVSQPTPLHQPPKAGAGGGTSEN